MFTVFQQAVAKQLKAMENYPLYRTDVEKDKLWETYLDSYPLGTNPIFRERTEHDCSCCRHFVKAVGNMVAITTNGKLMTIWDIKLKSSDMAEAGHYQVVADKMAELVRSKPISNVFAHTEPGAGAKFTMEQIDNGVRQWDHFYAVFDKRYVIKPDAIGPYLSERKATHDVFERGLKEISNEAVDTVLELIDQNSLYRGADHKFVLSKFKEAQRLYAKASNKDIWPWFFMTVPTAAVLRIRNTSIGTLLVNLSEGMPLDTAVGKFEALMAPSNYKRPTALITKGMIEKAKAEVEELGLTSALDRRYATIEDITVNNVLWADRSVKPHMAEASPFDDLATTDKVSTNKFDKVEEVKIDEFIENILPNVNSIEVMMENRINGNLFSLIAPQDPEAKGMFKWDNNFSWSYMGEVADSMKERVKQAGGDVTGDVRFSIQWNDEDVHNQSDYDAHCYYPNGLIYFSQTRHPSVGGKLDVDIQCPSKGKPAVENITFEARRKMLVGDYKMMVHNFSRRNGDTGFRAQIEFDGVIHNYEFDQPLKQDQKVLVATVHVDRNHNLTITHNLPNEAVSKDVWGIKTEQFVKVETIMFSPNYWDDRSQGNKHHFFVLEGCANPEDSRGFYNEFLNEGLNVHRKVFEVLGSKLRAPHTDRQLSGVGFSSTVRNHVFCKVAGNFTRTLKVLF